MRLRIIRLEGNGAAITGDGFIGLAKAGQRDAQITICFGTVGFRCKRLRDQLTRLQRITLLVKQETKKMKSICVIGIELQLFKVKFLCLIQPASLMVV